MDAQVENHLGNSISYTDANGDEHQVTGFLTFAGSADGIEGLDPIRRQWHAKISMAQLPAGPASMKRITSPLLPTVYRPAADTIDNDGHDWLFDLQKAPMP